MAEKMLKDLHASYMRDNEYDEGDLIFYRINYRLADALGLTKEDANQLHLTYHLERPRRVSEGYCDKCGKVVSIIPIIYGIQNADVAKMEAAKEQGRLIIGDLNTVRNGVRAPMFGCKMCRTPLPKYGMI
ncbi:MAG: hypothetical protein ACREBU_14850 [Nitrososphaera sp.]